MSPLPPHPFSGAQLTYCTADYVAETTTKAVDTALGYQSTAWNRAPSGSRRVPFNRFVWDVIRRASVKMPVLLTTLVYITRAKSHLHIETEDWACERVFLGALMVASKVCSLCLLEFRHSAHSTFPQYTNDSTLRNVHWALATNVFGKRDVNRIEREFIDVLAWKLDFTESDILVHHSAIVSLYIPQKRLSNPLPSPSHSPLTTTTTTTPSVRHAQPKDTSTPVRKSTTSYDLSSPPPLLYPVTLATQPFLKTGEARHSNTRSNSSFPGFPRPWHGKNHSMPGQHTLPRISV